MVMLFSASYFYNSAFMEVLRQMTISFMSIFVLAVCDVQADKEELFAKKKSKIIS